MELKIIILTLLIAFLIWTIFRVNSYNPKRWYYYWKNLFYYRTEPKRFIPVVLVVGLITFAYFNTEKLPEPFKEKIIELKSKLTMNEEQQACYDSVQFILDKYKTFLESYSNKNFLGTQITSANYDYSLSVLPTKEAGLLNRKYYLT